MITSDNSVMKSAQPSIENQNQRPLQIDFQDGFNFAHDKPWINFGFTYLKTDFQAHIPVDDPEFPSSHSDTPLLFLDAIIGKQPYQSENSYGYDLLHQIIRACTEIDFLHLYITQPRDVHIIARIEVYAPVNIIHIISALSDFILKFHPVLEVLKLATTPHNSQK